MQVTTISYRHAQRRTRDFQCVESSIEVSAQVEEGDTASQVVKALRNQVRILVRDDVERAIAEISGTVIEHVSVTTTPGEPLRGAVAWDGKAPMPD